MYFLGSDGPTGNPPVRLAETGGHKMESIPKTMQEPISERGFDLPESAEDSLSPTTMQRAKIKLSQTQAVYGLNFM